MILCLDTSSLAINIFLVENKKIVFQSNKKGKSQYLFEHLPENLRQVSQVVVGTGPGSFTGLRVGITFAKVFCSIQKIPLSGVNSLDSFQNPESLPIYSRSRSGEVYEFNSQTKILKIIKEEDCVSQFVGPLNLEKSDCLDPVLFSPDPFLMISKADFTQDWNLIKPNYTRGSYAEEKSIVK